MKIKARKIILFGDSGNSYNDTGNASFGSATAAPSSNGASFAFGLFERFQVATKQPFTVVSNAGVAGNTTAQMLARIKADVLDVIADYVFFFTPGSNDYIGSSITSDDTIKNLRTMFGAIRDSGKVILTATIPPRSDYNQTSLLHANKINWFLKEYAASNGGFYLADVFPYTYDTSSMANSVAAHPASGVTLDGLHYNCTGAALAIKAMTDAYSCVLPKLDRRTFCNNDATNGDLTVVSPNPLMIQGSGGYNGTGITGTLAQGYYAQRDSGAIAAVASIVARSDGATDFPDLFGDLKPGFLQKFAISGSTSNTDQLILALGTSGVGSSSGPWVIECELGIKATSGTIKSVYLHGFVPSSSAPYEVFANTVDLASDNLNSTKFSGVLRTRPFYTPANVNAMPYCNLSFILSSGGAATAWVGDYHWKKLSA